MKLTTRRILILAPLVVTVFLLQSYFWVPTYEEQTKGNPYRLDEYIMASIGDASILNPILSADSASSTIEGMVFEGLIDYDRNLRFRARLASSWEIYEEAYFYVNQHAEIPGLGRASAEEVVGLLERAVAGKLPLAAETRTSLDSVRHISVISPHEFTETRQERGQGASGQKEVKIRVQAPARIMLVLNRVEPDLFRNLAPLLGNDYFSSFPAEKFLSYEQGAGKAGQASSDTAGNLDQHAKDILPPTEQNPIILFHLRPNVTFQDGHPFDATDVKFTYEAIMDPKNISPRLADYEPVKRVEIVDPMTVRIVYKRLYSPAVGTWTIGILPEHLLNREALRKEALRRGMDPEKFSMRQSLFNRHPVGCGPFEFKEWKSDQYITLKHFERYWEGPANYKRFVYRIIPDVLTQEMEFYAGTVDTYDVQPYQVARFTEDPRYQSFSGLSFGYSYIGYNMRREPFNDRRVRTALGMAVDVDRIIKYVLYSQGERITGPFPEQTDYYDHHVKPLPYDPEGALKLLEEAGWKKNSQGWLEKEGKRLQFTLITNSGNDTRKAIMAIVQDAWRQIGIDVRTDLLEWSVFIQNRVEKDDFDALILGWQMGIEPDLYQIWHSSQTHPYQLNFVGFKNAEADDLIIKIREEYNHEKQVRYCHELHKLIAYEQPYTFLYVGKWTAVLDKRIVIKEVNAQGKVVYKKITPTKTGNYMYDFNKWIKLPKVPNFAAEG
jgi:ABC-type transport system substrate-binding protein